MWVDLGTRKKPLATSGLLGLYYCPKATTPYYNYGIIYLYLDEYNVCMNR